MNKSRLKPNRTSETKNNKMYNSEDSKRHDSSFLTRDILELFKITHD